MKIRHFLTHYFISTLRTTGSGQKISNLILKLLSFFWLLICILISILIGGDSLLEKLFTGYSATESLAILLIPASLLGITYRIFLQDLTMINPDQYKLLPVGRRQLAGFFFTKPLLNPLQYLFFLFVAIITAKQAILGRDASGGGWLVLSSFFLIVFNISITNYIKERFNINEMLSLPLTVAYGFAIYGCTLLPDIIVLPVENTLAYTFTSWIGTLFWFVLDIFAYKLNMRYFVSNYNKDDENNIKSDSRTSYKIERLMKGNGETMTMLRLIIKQMIRINYMKSLIISFCIIPVILPIIIKVFNTYPTGNEISSVALFIGIGIFATSTTYSMQYKFFDLLMVQNISIKGYVYANFYIYFFNMLAGAITFTAANFFFPMVNMEELLLFYLLEMGIVLQLIMIFAVKNILYPEVMKGVKKKREQIQISTALIILSYILGAMLLTMLATQYSTLKYILIFINAFIIIFHRKFLLIAVWNFKRNKYKMLQRFHAKL